MGSADCVRFRGGGGETILLIFLPVSAPPGHGHMSFPIKVLGSTLGNWNTQSNRSQDDGGRLKPRCKAVRNSVIVIAIELGNRPLLVCSPLVYLFVVACRKIKEEGNKCPPPIQSSKQRRRTHIQYIPVPDNLTGPEPNQSRNRGGGRCVGESL